MRTMLQCGMIAVLAATTTGCVQWNHTRTARTAVEMQLLSTAADRAVGQMNLQKLKGKSVFVDAGQFSAVDKEYALAEIHAALLDAGARLAAADQAEVVAEVRSAVLANDHSKSLIGLPSLPIVIPGAGSFETPEMAIWSNIKQTGIAKFGIAGRDAATNEAAAATRGYGHAYYNRYTLLFLINWSTSDIPERRKGAFWGLFPSVAN